MKTKEQISKNNHKYYLQNKESILKKNTNWVSDQKKTPEKYLKQKWSIMNRRCKGNDHKSKTCVGLPIISFETFLAWALKDESFNKLYSAWRDNGFKNDVKLIPSIDRLRNEEGYVLGNMQFLTQYKNMLKG